MAASSDEVVGQLPTTEFEVSEQTRHTILDKLFDKLINNVRTTAGKKMLPLTAAFQAMGNRSTSTLITAVCLTYQDEAKFFSSNHHTKLDIAAKILISICDLSDEDFIGREIMVPILIIEHMLGLYIELDNNSSSFFGFLPDSWQFLFKDETRAIDKVSYQSTLFFYIREAFKRSIDRIFNNNPNILDNMGGLSSLQVSIVINLLALRNMYIGTQHEAACFRLIYKLVKDHTLDNLHLQVIGSAYKHRPGSATQQLLTSIDTLMTFTNLQLGIRYPDASILMFIPRFINNILAVFHEPCLPDLSDIFDRLTNEQYQSLTKYLVDSWRINTDENSLLQRGLTNERFWYALLNKATSTRENAGSDAISGDFISWLIYSHREGQVQWFGYPQRVVVVWQAILTEPRFHPWFVNVLRVDPAVDDQSAGMVSQSISIFPLNVQQTFVDMLVGTLSQALVQQIVTTCVASSHLVETWKDETILAVGTLLLSALTRNYAISSVASHFIVCWISALFKAHRFDELSILATRGYVTQAILEAWFSKEAFFEGVVDEEKIALIRALLYQSSTSAPKERQPSYNAVAQILWSYETQDLYRAHYLPCLISDADFTHEQCLLAADRVWVSSHQAMREAFKHWCDRYKDHEAIGGILFFQRRDRIHVALFISYFMMRSLETESFEDMPSSRFWTSLITIVGMSGVSQLLITTMAASGYALSSTRLKMILLHRYQYRGQTQSMIDLFHDFMAGHCTEASFDATKALRSLFDAIKNNDTFTSNDWLDIFSLFFRTEVSQSYIDFVSSYMHELFFILREREPDCNHQDFKMLEWIKNNWQWLLTYMPPTSWIEIINSLGKNRKNFLENFIIRNRRVGFSMLLQASHLYGSLDSQAVLATSLSRDADIYFFDTLVNLINVADLEKYEVHNEHSILGCVIKHNDLDSMYITKLFDHYRLLKGDTDLNTMPTEDIIRDFLKCACVDDQNLLYQAIVAGNVTVAIWLLNLAEPIITEILNDAVVSMLSQRTQSAKEQTLAIDIWLLRRGLGASIWASSSLVQASWGSLAIKKAVMQYQRRGSQALAVITTESGKALQTEIQHMSVSLQSITCLATQAPSLVQTFFGFETALAQELELREQPLDRWLQWLQPQSALRQALLVWLSVAPDASLLRQTLNNLILKPVGLSQQSLQFLQRLWTELGRIPKLSTDVSVKVPLSEPSVCVSQWVAQFLQLVKLQQVCASHPISGVTGSSSWCSMPASDYPLSSSSSLFKKVVDDEQQRVLSSLAAPKAEDNCPSHLLPPVSFM